MIAILGAKGNIGNQIVHALSFYCPEILVRKGTRHLFRDAGADWKSVDIQDENSLQAFFEGCDLIINAAGPAKKYSKTVAEAVVRAGVPLIDVGEHEVFQQKLSEKVPVVYGCGAVPGMIGLLPLILAKEFSSVESLQVDYIIQEVMTLTAATDMAQRMQVNKNEPKGAYMGSVPEQVPILGDIVYRYPYIDQEAFLVTQRLAVANYRWSMVRQSDDLEKLLFHHRGDQETLALELQQMSRIYSNESQCFICFLIEIQGKKKGEKESLTCFAKSKSAALVAGHAVAATTAAILAGEVKAETVRMPFCSAWEEIWNRIYKQKIFSEFLILPNSLDSMRKVQEGEL